MRWVNSIARSISLIVAALMWRLAVRLERYETPTTGSNPPEGQSSTPIAPYNAVEQTSPHLVLHPADSGSITPAVFATGAIRVDSVFATGQQPHVPVEAAAILSMWCAGGRGSELRKYGYDQRRMQHYLESHTERGFVHLLLDDDVMRDPDAVWAVCDEADKLIKGRK